MLERIKKSLFGEPKVGSSQIQETIRPISDLPSNVRLEELGAPGTTLQRGYIDEDYNSLFSGATAYETYDEMRRSDGTIYKTLSAAQLPIVNAQWKITPGIDRNGEVVEGGMEIAEFVEWNMFELLEGGFESFMMEVLNFLRDGVSVFEKVYQMKDGQYCIKKLGVRLPKTILKWEMENQEPGIVQQLSVSNDGKPIKREIPGSKLLVFTNRKEGDNYKGMSVLRPVAKNWIAKKYLENFELVGYETQFKGVRKVRVGAGTDKADKDAFLEKVADFDIGNDNTIILPGADFDFDFVTMDLPSAQHIHEAIKRHEAKITDVMLGFFIKLGEAQVGSYAQSQTGLDFFIIALEHTAKYISSIINNYLIRELVDLNFSNVEYYPTLSAGRLGPIDVNIISQAIQRLSQSGIITPDQETEQWARETVGMPAKMDEEEGGQKPERKVAKKEDKQKEDEEIYAQLSETIDNSFYISDLSNEQIEKLKKKEFSEAKYNYRPVTFAEQKVDLSGISKKLDQFEQRFKAEFSGIVQKKKQAILQQIKKAVESNNVEALSKISAGSHKELFKIILDIRKDVFNFGKDSASNEIEKTVPKTKQETKAYMNLESENMAKKVNDIIESQTKDVVTQLIGRNNGSITALATAAAITDVSGKLDQTFDKVLAGAQTLSIMNSFNVGRSIVYNENIDEIYAYQYSAILDSKTTDRCMSLDGRVFKPGSADMIDYAPPQHINCRSILVGILSDETFKPKITGTPKYISPVRDITNAGDLKRPYITKNSPAIGQLQQELQEREQLLEQYRTEGKFPNRQKQHEERIAQIKKALPKGIGQ